MKFESQKGGLFFLGGKIIAIPTGEYETTDKAEIDALKKVKGVNEVKSKPKSK